MEESNNSSNDRIGKLMEVIMRVAGGDYSVQAEVSGRNDEIDSLAFGINMLIDDLETGTVRHEYVDIRVKEILAVVRNVAKGDYSSTCRLSPENNNFDALGTGLNMMIEDVRGTHQALKESEEKFKAQYKGIPVPTYTWQWNQTRNDFVLIDYNDAARAITRGGVVDFIGKNAREMYAGRPDIVTDLANCFREKEVINRKMTMKFSKSGDIKHLSVSYVSVPPDLVMAHTEDISKRKQAEEEIHFKNVLLETQTESSIEGILAVDNEGKVISHNKRFNEIWELPAEIIETKDDKKMIQFVVDRLKNPDAFIEKIDYLYANKYEKSRDEITLKDGRIIDRYSKPLISANDDHFGRIWFFRDITEMRAMQETIVQQERLMVLGQLAGGIGHELRNPLGAIKNAVYFLNMSLENAGPEVMETLQIVEEEVANSERIITSLLDYARSKPPLKRKVAISHIIEEVLARINVPGSIVMENRFDETIPLLMADPYQLDQVFGNILLNAVQAMPQGGRLQIKAEIQAPDLLAITFADSGVGIPAENLPRIFTPLFTGKAKGIGLGMAITKTFVEGHGGSIEVTSEEGQGTTFTVKLPIGT